MFWYTYMLIGLLGGVALVWLTGLVLCHRAGQAQVLIWEKSCGDEAGVPGGNTPALHDRRENHHKRD